MPELSYWQIGLIVVFITVALLFDVKTMKIPNSLNAAGIALGFTFQVMTGGIFSIFHAGTGFLIGFVTVFLLYVCKAVGAGDVKCFAALGAMGGWEFAVLTLVYSLLFGGGFGLACLMVSCFRKPDSVRFSAWIWTMAIRRRCLPFHGDRFARFPFMCAVWPAALWTIGGETMPWI